MPSPYVFIITTDPRNGADLASCDGLSARSARGCAARALARMLIEAGREDGPVEARGADGRLRYTVRSVAAFARTALIENPGIRVVPWRESRWGSDATGALADEGPDATA